MKVLSVLFCLSLMAATAFAQQHLGSRKSHTENGGQVGLEALVNRYFDSLNETDAVRRRELTEQVWAERGKFGTPYGEVEGREAIANLIAGVQKRFPKSTVRRTTKIDGFGKYWRWGFTLSEADGTPILSGIDFAMIENGKLQLVMGFFDFAP
jgi:hypothetical protein